MCNQMESLVKHIFIDNYIGGDYSREIIAQIYYLCKRDFIDQMDKWSVSQKKELINHSIADNDLNEALIECFNMQIWILYLQEYNILNTLDNEHRFVKKLVFN